MDKYITLVLLFSCFTAIAQKMLLYNDCAAKRSPVYIPDGQPVQHHRLQYTTPDLMTSHRHICVNNNSTDLPVSKAAAVEQHLKANRQRNCSYAGELVCRTITDHNSSGYSWGDNINASCICIGNVTDANNFSSTPPVRNLMTYGRFECRNRFTTNQNDRMQLFFFLPGGPHSCIAPDNYVNNSNTNFSFGTHAHGARTSATITPHGSYVLMCLSSVYYKSGNGIVFKAGETLAPGANGPTRGTLMLKRFVSEGY